MALPVPLNLQASGSSSAFGQTGMISLGGTSYGAPGGASGILREVMTGVLVAVLVAVILKQSKG